MNKFTKAICLASAVCANDSVIFEGKCPEMQQFDLDLPKLYGRHFHLAATNLE